VEKGVVTGARRRCIGQVIASFAMGTQRLYDALHENPMYGLYPIEYVADPHVIANNHAMVSVTQAFSIDLTGQVCSDQFGGQPYGGVGAQPEFLRGAANAPLGKPIVCLASTTEDGKTSRIRPLLPEGEAATIARSDVHWVVTEYGHAYLFGKSVRERALALLRCAHPRSATACRAKVSAT
jgi:acyl-CoA hydrolase